ncbi:MAG: cation:proton antiporter [candidate division Zixibacteria bacterium]|nr:cation:proton antiporter [candidate division Zixibacteria bacterium]
MTDSVVNFPIVIIIIGALIISVIILKSLLGKLGIPSLVGFMLLGFLLRVTDANFGILSSSASEILEFMAKIGVISLLFKIGLESNLMGLLGQLRKASIVWVGDVLISAAVGFSAAYYLLHLELIQSLFVAVALTATSVGISVSVWDEAGALKSEKGELLIDVAELDDISGIVLMAVLFSIAPVLRESMNAPIVSDILRSTGIILMKLLLFGGACVLFSLYVERNITEFGEKISESPGPMLMTAGVGFIIASTAGLLGFSIAIGAFFAGLAFSRDPQSMKIDKSYKTLYELFSPFFFIGIGLSIEPGVLTSAVGIGAALTMAAFAGKIIGDGLPSWAVIGGSGAILIGVSMVPRAEIAMIIMHKGLTKGPWAVPSNVFAGMVLVSILTCIISPIITNILLKKSSSKWRN